MTTNRRPSFNPKFFLAKIGEARTLAGAARNYDCAIESHWTSCLSGESVQFCSDARRDTL
jgi:hypothetical protein